MASFIESGMRLLLKRRPKEGHMDEEQAANLAAASAAANNNNNGNVGSTTISSTLDPASSQHLREYRGSYFIPNDDPLQIFRSVLGITTSPFLGFGESRARPAANIGIYARVVDNEQKANDSYKVFSVVINGCYFLQIVIAAALTALGAANASGRAVTVFGALNTVIAGFLTFLKGSGLPGRLKFYGNEWKKIREYIEQRERDFAREGCALNVYEELAKVEDMYKNSKEDIETNTPDAYHSMTSRQRTAHSGGAGGAGGFDMSKLEGMLSKLKGPEGKLGGKIGHVVEEIEKRTHDMSRGVQEHEKRVTEGVKSLERDVADELEARRQQASDGRDRIEAEGRQGRDGLSQAVEERGDRMAAEVREQNQRVADFVAGRSGGERSTTTGTDEKHERTIP